MHINAFQADVLYLGCPKHISVHFKWVNVLVAGMAFDIKILDTTVAYFQMSCRDDEL